MGVRIAAVLGAAAVVAYAAEAFGDDKPGNCSIYSKTPYSNCPKNCGSCFNPGSRAGVLCGSGTQTGYLCTDDAYACMDWTFGSKTLQRAEAAFTANTSEAVYFGVGSFGSSDPMKGLGACFRMTIDGVDRDIIVQAVNTGSDVQGNQFDMQVGDGGFGANNKCVGGSGMMYPGDPSKWGDVYGGVKTRAECAGLPKYPVKDGPMKAAGDDLVSLCEYSFDKKVRIEPPAAPSNPTIRNMARVKCPAALVELTWLERSDDPPTYTGHSLPGFPNKNHTCQEQSWDLSYCLTRMMDCCKPSGAWRSNVEPGLVIHGKKVVQTCTADGYTRIDVQCGCYDCDC